jgi:hypothetical protein
MLVQNQTWIFAVRKKNPPVISRIVYGKAYLCSWIPVSFRSMIWYDMICLLNYNWVATRWQQHSTHLHTNHAQNDTKHKQYIERDKNFWNSTVPTDLWSFRTCDVMRLLVHVPNTIQQHCLLPPFVALYRGLTIFGISSEPSGTVYCTAVARRLAFIGLSLLCSLTLDKLREWPLKQYITSSF